jgi:PAS domain S-box-containing protein
MTNEAAGTVMSVECTINPLPSAKNKVGGYVYLIKNIEERKNMEAIQSRLASIITSSKDAIIGIDTSGVIKTWNAGAENILGYSYDEVAGQNISMLTPSSYPNELPGKIEQLKGGGIIEHYESLRQTKNGNLIQMSILPSAIKDSKGNITGISFIARDITEKKELEKEVMEISERERERIGQDLHDSLGQQLTGILLNLSFVEKELKNENPALDLGRLSETSELIKTSISQTRNLAKTLVPLKLQTEGLPYALSDLANYAREVYEKEVETQIDYEIKGTDIIVETQLYHIAQEAINNAAKHSGGDKINISLKIAQSELVLSVKDNGRGMKEKSGEGLGLRIMKYRASLINGTVFVNGENGEGALLICRVPIHNTETE